MTSLPKIPKVAIGRAQKNKLLAIHWILLNDTLDGPSDHPATTRDQYHFGAVLLLLVAICRFRHDLVPLAVRSALSK